MRLAFLASCAALALTAVGLGASQALSAAPPLRVAGHTDLPGYTGDFDHFAVDLPDNRLFLAGEDGGVLEVFDLKSGALLKTLPGFDAPHSLIYLPETSELVVVANKDSRVLDARTLARKRTLSLGAGADSIAYDPPRKRAYVVTGGKDVDMKTTALVEFDPYTGKVFGRTDFDGDHTEALAIEEHGQRIFINQTDKNLLDVVDKTTHAIRAKWPVTAAKQNAPIAYDEASRRLFVVTRQPGKLLVLDADSGATVQSFEAPARVDQVVWDPTARRVFVCGGDGRLAIFDQQDADHYRELPGLATPPASKTCVYVPSMHRLYLAASPGETKSPAQLVWVDLPPRR